MKAVTEKTIKECSQNFQNNPKNLLARNALTHVDFTQVAMCRKTYFDVEHTFSHQIKDEGKATNQKSSGRCWLFAALNVMRLAMMEKYKMDQFEFSQTYLFFWDKLEKSNFFLENILATLNEETSDRTLMWILQTPINDGGQWDMFVNLVNKYGVIPKTAMPESYSSGHSNQLNSFLNRMLREFACELRNDHKDKATLPTLRKKKTEMLNEIFRILTIFLGEPPQTFDWSFRDKKKKFSTFLNLTPQAFYKKHVPYNVDDQVCLINAPTKDKPFNKLYTVKYLGNVVGGELVRYINLPSKDLRKYAMASLKDHNSVWFGCDVGKEFSRKLGVMDTKLYDYDLLFGITPKSTKAERLDYGQSQMTHAMVFTGVDVRKDGPRKWRVENSWGDEYGDKGYMMMGDDWFDEYLYEIVVDKKYVPKKVKDILKQKPIVLSPWDPMGSLA